jgi:hypothetical protein
LSLASRSNTFSNEPASNASEIADGLRLLKAFRKLTPEQRREIIELVERRSKQ